MKRITRIVTFTLSCLALAIILGTMTSKKVKAQVDEGRIAYQSTIDRTGICSGLRCIFTFPAVPAGRRVVIEHISGALSFTGSSGGVSLYGIVSAVPPNVESFFAPHNPFCASVATCNDPPYSLFDQPVELYVDAGQKLELSLGPINSGVNFDPTGAAVGESITLTGYELNCSATPCSPIAH